MKKYDFYATSDNCYTYLVCYCRDTGKETVIDCDLSDEDYKAYYDKLAADESGAYAESLASNAEPEAWYSEDETPTYCSRIDLDTWNFINYGEIVETECEHLAELNKKLESENAGYHYKFCFSFKTAFDTVRGYIREDNNGKTFGNYVKIYYDC